MILGRRKFKRRWLNLTYRGPERRRGKRIVFMLLWTILFALIFYRFVVTSCVVQGDSMEPTLRVGSYHLVDRLSYFFKDPQRGDIVVLFKPQVVSFYLIKRIVGLPGETVGIQFGHVYLNGKKLEEPYIEARTEPDKEPFELKEHEYFVLGDNREVADDSRYWGPVHRREIIGKLFSKVKY